MSDTSKVHSPEDKQWSDFAVAFRSLNATGIPVVRRMLELADRKIPFSSASGILDNGCGPGMVMKQLIETYTLPDASTLICADWAEGMLKQVQDVKNTAVQANASSSWQRVQTLQQDAMDLKDFQDGTFSHITAGFLYMLLADPQKALSESRRVLQPGGVLTLSVWQTNQWLDLMNLLPSVRPDKQMPGLPAEWKSVKAVRGELEKAGFKDVEVETVDCHMKFESADFIAEFLVTKMPHMILLTKDFTAEEVARLKSTIAQEARKMAGEPGSLTGKAIVATGAK